jgi:hypothetical protein
VFLSLDPISSMHMGLSNNPDEHNRAELLCNFLLRKIPNTLIIDEKTGRECFIRKRESEKMELTKSQKMAALKKNGGRWVPGILFLPRGPRQMRMITRAWALI